MSDPYLEYLDALPPKTRERIMRSTGALQNGMHMVAPVICTGPNRCRWIEWCPIPERTAKGEMEFGPAEDYPVGRGCVIEKLFMQAQTKALQRQLEVDPDDPIEMAIVNEIALVDTYKNRCAMILSKGDRDGQGTDFMRIDIKGWSENGSPSEEAKIHPVAEMMEKLERRRERWLDRLMATRKGKADLAARAPSQENSRILREIEALKQGLLGIATPVTEIETTYELVELGD